MKKTENVIGHFEKIISYLSESGLGGDFFASAKEPLAAAAAYLRSSETQAALFAVLLDKFIEGPVSVKCLSETLRCGNLELLKYLDDFEALESRKLVRAERRHSDYGEPPFSRKNHFPRYYVPLDVINAIRKGEEYKPKNYEALSPHDFFDLAADMLDPFQNDDLELDAFASEINSLLDQNKHISFVQSLAAYDLSGHKESVFIMLILCCSLLHYGEDLLDIRYFSRMFGRREAYRVQHLLQSREHELFTNGLLEFDFQMGMADTEYCRLSQKAKDEFLSDVDIKEKTRRQGKGLIKADAICEKKLYYSEKLARRVGELASLLGEANFSSIQKRLSERGMRGGFSCIFYGPAGTGKTETAYQIARQTGRDIFFVDIAETKSMWFGESEKLIKAVFDRYKGMTAAGGLSPILLFNEADAVMGRRQELSAANRGPAQTENAIQNIILQEMENLNGILIATTNLTVNLDRAFERRFLYKIEFEKPDAESKKRIWQSLIPSISAQDASLLSAKFDFSGGQIENISRKCTVDFVLSGSAPSVERLLSFCDEEQMNRENSFNIGFARE